MKFEPINPAPPVVSIFIDVMLSHVFSCGKAGWLPIANLLLIVL